MNFTSKWSSQFKENVQALNYKGTAASTVESTLWIFLE